MSSDTPTPKPPRPPKVAPNNMSDALSSIHADDLENVKRSVAAEVNSILVKYGCEKYKFLILYDDVDEITTYHTDSIYSSATTGRTDQEILLLINSNGGRIEPSYLISKTLKRLSNGKFLAAVPRRAKSAATLIALGADEIHMGMMSELGPIDPQLGGLPALSLGNALDVIAELVCKFPDSAPLLGKYISDNVPVRTLGYYQRVNESAVQYAERLLSGKPLGKDLNSHDAADRLVNHYKDHSFVIDSEEAATLLGTMIKEQTPEYNAADEIFKFLDLLAFVCRQKKKKIWVVGNAEGFAWAEDRRLQ